MDYGPIRAIKDDIVLSPSLPRLGIRFSPDFIYLGDLHFIAQEKYHVEEFIFLNPNGLGYATRLLILHFAGFLENKEGAYEYSFDKTIRLDDEEYQYEARLIDVNRYLTARSGSAMAHAADYIRQRAYTLVGEMVLHSFMRLVSPDRRNQFLIAHLESNTDPLLTPAILEQDQVRAQALLDRALNSFTILH